MGTIHPNLRKRQVSPYTQYSDIKLPMTVSRRPQNRCRILVICSPKGGCSKTTLALNLGATFAGSNRVLLIDADPNQSAMKWYGKNGHLPADMDMMGTADEIITVSTIVRIVHKYQFYYDLIIVDSPPSQLASTVTRSALITADLALIPVTPSPLDMWEVTEMNHIIDEVNELRQSMDVAPVLSKIVLTRARKNTRMTNLVFETFARSRFSICNSIIREREIYKFAAFNACSIYDMTYTGKEDAVSDLNDLYREISPLLGLQA